MRAIPPTTPPTIAPTGRDFEPDAEEATVDDVAVLWSRTELGALVAEAKTVVTQMAVLGVAWGWPTATASSKNGMPSVTSSTVISSVCLPDDKGPELKKVTPVALVAFAW